MRTHTGFDGTFRPTCYWQLGDPIATVIHDIKGNFRRHRVHAMLLLGSKVPVWALAPKLDRHGLDALDELGLSYRVPIERTDRPLSFAELTRFLDGIRREGRRGPGVIQEAIRPYRREPSLKTYGAAAAWIRRARNAVHIISDHYPEAAKWGERVVDAKLPLRPNGHRVPKRSIVLVPPRADRATEPVPVHWEPKIEELLFQYEATGHFWPENQGPFIALADLAAFLRRYALEHSRLPTGLHVIQEESGERYEVDFDSLLDEEGMMERVLVDGTAITEWKDDQVLDELAATGRLYGLRAQLYLVGSGRLFGPFEAGDEVAHAFLDMLDEEERTEVVGGAHGADIPAKE